MSEINWELFTEESIEAIEAIADKYNWKYSKSNDSERTEWKYIESTKFQGYYDGGDSVIVVEWTQDHNSGLEWSTIKIIPTYDEDNTESMTLGDVTNDDLEDFEVFVDMEDFRVDTDEYAFVLHVKGIYHTDMIKDQSLFPDSEVEPYRKNFIDTTVKDKIFELIDIQE